MSKTNTNTYGNKKSNGPYQLGSLQLQAKQNKDIQEIKKSLIERFENSNLSFVSFNQASIDALNTSIAAYATANNNLFQIGLSIATGGLGFVAIVTYSSL